MSIITQHLKSTHHTKFKLPQILLLVLTLILVWTIPSEGQNRGGLIAKLRRRGTNLLGKNKPGSRVNEQGLEYNAPEPLRFRSDFHSNHYLPGLPYWRLDNEMPGVTRADRFRGNYNGYSTDYFRGRLSH
jgi:hypothetical protein